jgi:hypothetical protein
MTDYNARDYISSTFIKKAELRSGGPRRLAIRTVEEGEGLPGRNGQAPKKELQLVFTDDSRFSLRAQTNLRRMFEAFGDRTSLWVGREIELYFSPDVVNPGGGEPGGIRLRLPDAVSVPTSRFVSELDETPPKGSGAAKPSAKRTAQTGTRASAVGADESAF